MVFFIKISSNFFCGENRKKKKQNKFSETLESGTKLF